VQSRLAQVGCQPPAHTASTPPRRPRPRTAPWFYGALVALAFAPGCAARATHVERGERYRAGSPRFDAYFADVHASHHDVDAAAERRRRARARLARSLGLDADASTSRLTRSVHEKSEALARKGVRLRVGEGGATAVGGPEEPSPVVQNLSSCVHAEAETVEWSSRARQRAHALRSRGQGLEPHLNELPWSRRDEGRRELRAADHDLSRQSERARSMGAESERFLASLRDATDEPKAHAKPHSKAHPKASPAHHPASKPPPPSAHPPAPKPPPAPGQDDFNP
jgi:hypothetical protein